MSAEEKELIRLAQEGNVNAFEQLVHRYDKRVMNIGYRYTGSTDDAKDIYQEVFLRAYRSIRSFKQESEFSTWLHRITANVCLTAIQRKKRFPLSGDKNDVDSGETVMENVPGDSSPLQETMNTEIREKITEALNGLSPQQRLIFSLRHYEGYSFAEIASALKCSEGTVKRHMFNALQRMRKRLQILLQE